MVAADVERERGGSLKDYADCFGEFESFGEVGEGVDAVAYSMEEDEDVWWGAVGGGAAGWRGDSCFYVFGEIGELW